MKKRIWNQLKKAVMITAAVGILGTGAVSAAEFEAAELYVPAVGLKQSAQWIDEEKFQAELTLEVSGLKELYKSQQENTASENGQLQMENSTWDGEVREAEAAENTTDEVDSENTECESESAVIDIEDIKSEVDIRPEDIKMDVYRASGAGGQHINKTSSAVRLTHIPTGIVTSCQTQRSQFQNRDYAMKMLKAELIKIKEREHLEKIEDIKGVQKEIAWGAQIRSYVFMPYTLVKDHRTGFENSNVNAVMDGDLDGFINAYLKALSLGEIEK